MKTLIQIIYVKSNAGTSKKTGNAYDMRMAQTIAHVMNEKTGVMEPLVGELVLPEKYKEIQPGYYLVDFKLSVSRERRIESVVDTLTQCDEKGNPLRAPAAARQAA